MRAPLGMLLILVGVVMGYLVLTGKLPSSTPIVPAASSPSSIPPPAGSNGGVGGPHPVSGSPGGAGGPYNSTGSHDSTLGLPTLQNLQDMNASTGGYA